MERIKHYLLNHVILLATALWLGGCSDQNDMPDVNPVSKGDAIIFTTNDVQSRSIYGDKDENGYRIWWLDGDKITIHSMDAIVGETGTTTPNGTHEAGYTVNRSDDYDYHGTIIANDKEKQMLWKDATSDHTFYAAYPTQRFEKVENRKITMAYHTNQVCDIISTNNGEYKTQPDMLNAYMMAKDIANPQNAGHVLLNFDPIMTTLDIKVTAGKYEVGTGIINPITITGVSVIMPNHLENGVFTYNMSNGDRINHTDHPNTWQLENVKSGAESVFVNIRSNAGDTNEKYYLDLFEDESVEVMAFIPPMQIDKNADCYVKVHTTAGYDFVKRVTTTQGLPKRSRIEIRLPDIYPEGEAPGGAAKEGNNWMSKLNQNTPIKRLSIPGYTCTTETTVDQIKSLLNHGVRAFDLDALSKKNNTLDNTFVDIFNDFAKEHSNEVIFVWIHSNALGDHFSKPIGWLDMPTSLSDTKGIIALELHTTIGQHFFTNSNKSSATENNRLFSYDKDVKTISLSDSWNCRFISDNANQTCYNQIVSAKTGDNLTQDGFTGIVMIPDADRAYDTNGNPTYSDLLIQAVIDCNFKLNLYRN